MAMPKSKMFLIFLLQTSFQAKNFRISLCQYNVEVGQGLEENVCIEFCDSFTASCLSGIVLPNPSYLGTFTLWLLFLPLRETGRPILCTVTWKMPSGIVCVNPRLILYVLFLSFIMVTV